MITQLTIFYDGQCGLCCGFRDWLMKQHTYLTLRFVPYLSDEARRIFPEIDRYDPEEELVVVSDEGGIYQGADSWIMCLWATRGHRAWAERLSTTALKPMVRRVCHAVSGNRHHLSKLFGAPPTTLAIGQAMRQLDADPACRNGSCRTDSEPDA